MNKKYENLLSSYLTKKRLKHSISTAVFMEKNAELFNISRKNAYISGLFHDISKDKSDTEIVNLAVNFNKRKIINIKYMEFKKKFPVLLHGAASAEIILTELKITDTDILEAVCHHTCGGTKLGKLSKLTFICDFCEPLREYENSKKVYEMLINEKNFNKAYKYSYIFLLEHLIDCEKIICPESFEGYNEALGLSE